MKKTLDDDQIKEIRRWAAEHFQPAAVQPRLNREGTAALNREIIDRLDQFLWIVCPQAGVEPPEELIALIAHQLRVDGNIRNEPREKIKQMTAAAALVREPTMSDRKLAKLCGVSRPTIATWKKEATFKRYREQFERYPECIDDNLELWVSQISFAESLNPSYEARCRIYSALRGLETDGLLGPENDK